MIYVQQHPLTDPEAKEIHDWLNLPARRKFQAFLHNAASAHAAEAANLMARAFVPSVKNVEDPDEMMEAKAVMADAHRIRAAADILVKFADPESRFIMTTLLPTPITPTEEAIT